MFLYVWRYRFMRWLVRHTRYPRTVDEYLAIYPRYRQSLGRIYNSLYFYVPRFTRQVELYIDPECGEPELQICVLVPESQFEYGWQCIDKFLDEIVFEQRIQPYIHITCEVEGAKVGTQ